REFSLVAGSAMYGLITVIYASTNRTDRSPALRERSGFRFGIGTAVGAVDRPSTALRVRIASTDTSRSS
ncbi:hypothetical protein, partial [Microcoleus sp. POL10_C6]|uniref:hypothetical protein n=1 Tax=Microcoleus sp. POL10_C6 TaxID=2818852 RepID=UPI003B0C72DB